MTVPALAEISYTTTCGTFTFGAFAKSRLRATPVPSRSGTTTRGVQYDLTVEDYVISTNGIDGINNEMDDWATILTTRCGRLVYKGRGHDLDINNPAGAVRDIGGRDGLGPIPKLGEFYSLGGKGQLAAKVTWNITTTIPRCCGTTAYQNQLSDIGFDVAWSIDENQYQTRTISGILEVPVTRINGARQPSDQADDYRNLIEQAFPELPGFKRSRQFRLMGDRRTESFVITDRELEPTAFQKHMEDWRGTQTTKSMLAGKGFTIWTNNISASFRVQRDVSKVFAWFRFAAIVSSRIAAPVAKNFNIGFFQSIDKSVKELGLVPLDLEVRDSLHNQEVSFSFSYSHVTSPANFLVRAGMWQPLPNGKWEDWKAIAGANHVPERGHMGLMWKREWDAIIDLCVQKQPAIAPPIVNIKELGRKAAQVGADKAIRTPPKAEESYLAYEAHLRFIGVAGNARHKKLWYAPTALAPAHELDVNVTTHLQQGSASADIIQSVGSPSCRVVLYGTAVRVGYAVVPPKLLSISGVTATLDYEDIDNAEIGNSGSLPIFGGRWVAVYLLPSTPSGTIPVPPNRITPDTSKGAGVERV